MNFTLLSQAGKEQILDFAIVFFVGGISFCIAVFICLFFNRLIMKRVHGYENTHPKKAIFSIFFIILLIGWWLFYWKFSQLNEFILSDVKFKIFYGNLFVLIPSFALLISYISYCIYVHCRMKPIETPDDFYDNE